MKHLYANSFILLVLLSGCSSIERDIYFKNKNAKVSWSSAASQPGINSEAVVPVASDKTITIYANVLNRAEGSYTWGILLPVIPVFFLPNFHFRLDENENLKIQCHFLYNNKYEEIDTPTYRKTIIGKDKCTTLKVTLSDGSVLMPIKIHEAADNYETFEFNYKANDLRNFDYEVVEIQFANGQKKAVHQKFSVELEDFTRYHLLKIN